MGCDCGQMGEENCQLAVSRLSLESWPCIPTGGSLKLTTHLRRETAVAQWLRCYATNRKVAGSIPVGVSGFFIDINSSDRIMVLGSTQPLTEMSPRSISWGVKAAGA